MSDTATQVLAWIGALTGVGSLFLGIKNFLRDRGKLKITFSRGGYVVGHPDLSSDRTWGQITVRHSGRRPVYLEYAEFILSTGERGLPQQQSSQNLAEGSGPVTIWFDDHFDTPILCARARDGEGRHHYSRMSPFLRLRVKWALWRQSLNKEPTLRIGGMR